MGRCRGVGRCRGCPRRLGAATDRCAQAPRHRCLCRGVSCRSVRHRPYLAAIWFAVWWSAPACGVVASSRQTDGRAAGRSGAQARGARLCSNVEHDGTRQCGSATRASCAARRADPRLLAPRLLAAAGGVPVLRAALGADANPAKAVTADAIQAAAAALPVCGEAGQGKRRRRRQERRRWERRVRGRGRGRGRERG